ncbi:Uncharacterized protein BM_BM17171 [Brugia malayi]|uniref:Uncharacterized protein n=1 Tax=Brugia malayi TaxID=6279 RepID=A0A4E9FWT1_BRUMA|nr:Uncharacterized protein BM_BM17171 [Brugia malayi]VIP00233.1 Uncharacterized protein BM_BM17171 [Brugia malayi]
MILFQILISLRNSSIEQVELKDSKMIENDNSSYGSKFEKSKKPKDVVRAYKPLFQLFDDYDVLISP